MPSESDLKKALEHARKAKNSADHAVKELVDLHVPKQARKARLNLLAHLRRIARRMGARIPKLRERLKAKRKDGADKVADWAKKWIGITESPAFSNKGPYPITPSQVFTIGYDGVPWCGCFDALGAIEVGGGDVPLKARLAYTPYIVEDAKAGRNGLRAIPLSECRPGDLVVFDFDGGGADHTGIAVGPIVNGLTDCVEGNTSPSSGGSQSNGGGVYRRQRPTSQVAVVARVDGLH